MSALSFPSQPMAGCSGVHLLSPATNRRIMVQVVSDIKQDSISKITSPKRASRMAQWQTLPSKREALSSIPKKKRKEKRRREEKRKEKSSRSKVSQGQNWGLTPDLVEFHTHVLSTYIQLSLYGRVTSSDLFEQLNPMGGFNPKARAIFQNVILMTFTPYLTHVCECR
jgi:hypothetical protein